MTNHGMWTERAEVNRLFARLSYPDGADPVKLADEYLAGPEFAADMKGFNSQEIIDVETILLDATAASPLH